MQKQTYTTKSVLLVYLPLVIISSFGWRYGLAHRTNYLPLSENKPIERYLVGVAYALNTPPEATGRDYSPANTIKVIRGVCRLRGYDTTDCVSILYAMALKESGLNPDAVGDQGRSIGYYSIRVALHGVADDCARDLSCSTAWTLDNLISHGFPRMKTYAVARHNGGGAAAERYAVSVKRIARNVMPQVEAQW